MQRLEQDGRVAQWTHRGQSIEVQPDAAIATSPCHELTSLKGLVGAQFVDDLADSGASGKGPNVASPHRRKRVVGQLAGYETLVQAGACDPGPGHVALLVDSRRQQNVRAVEEGVLGFEQPIVTPRDEQVADEQAPDR
jgi:hypothetical protein